MEARVGRNQARPEGALEEVAVAAMPAVEGLGVLELQAMHALPEIRLRRLHEQVNVVRHEAVREADPAEPQDDHGEQPDVAAVVIVVDKDPPAFNAARIEMKGPVGKFESRFPSHDNKSPESKNFAP